MSSIQLTDLRKRYGKKTVLSGIDVHVPEGNMVTLLGSSGCGKSTTLRSVAGLDMPDGGEITLGNQVVFDKKTNVPARRRNVGMVFQSYALWPSMTVAANVAFPLKARSVKSADVRSRVAEMLEVVGLDQLADRYPFQLSGGQQQRVALARALVYRPGVMLFDEPLSNLDAKLRAQLRLEIRRIQREAGITALYVTHDTAEALSMSDTICIMRDGEIISQATPDELWSSPPSAYIARFLGCGTLVAGTVADAQGDRAEVLVEDQRVAVSTSRSWKGGESTSILLRDVVVQAADRPAPASHFQSLLATCLVSAAVGDQREAEYEIGGQRLRIVGAATSHEALDSGSQARLWFDGDLARAVDND